MQVEPSAPLDCEHLEALNCLLAPTKSSNKGRPQVLYGSEMAQHESGRSGSRRSTEMNGWEVPIADPR
jgi:hypothetical protein